MANLKLEKINKKFGKVHVMHDVDLDIDEGEFVVFVGPSGCGKSTLLRMIAGLESISSGTLNIGGKVMNDIPASQRGIAMVFQSYALYPHLSVADNMGFSLSIAKTPKSEIKTRVAEAAEILQLTPYLDRLPKALSGGQRQRVAIGRAIVREPDVFLFDEPLSNLDAELRVSTRREIAGLKASMPSTTMIYVTHDQVEAMTLADKIVVLRDGRVEQVGAPMDLYNNPANTFVAGFIGSPKMNFVPVTVTDGWADLGGAKKLNTTGNQKGFLTLGIRPEHLTLCDAKAANLTVTTGFVEALGEHQLVYAKHSDGSDLTVKVPTEMPLSQGQTLHLSMNPKDVHFFDADGQRA